MVHRFRWTAGAAVVAAFGVAAPVPDGWAGDAAVRPSEVIAVSPGDSPAQVIAKAASVVPSARQLAWQRLERTAFLHFSVNTYDGRTLGTGTEDPNIFQPTHLNTDQWVQALKNAGFKQAILTVKHHDGFLLFPSKYSKFGVASSSWAGGNGDVVRNFTTSAHKFGLKVGLYLSPADLHEAQPGGRYFNGSPNSPRTIPGDPAEIVNGRSFQVNTDDYNTYYMDTLYELLTRYGTVDELWWDGNNPTHKKQAYDFTDWIRIVRTLQPGAVIFQDIDIRWVGNEGAVGRQSEWSPLPYTGNPATAADRFIPPTTKPGASDKASDALLGQRNSDGTSAWNFLRWSPAECDVSMANGRWFWTPGVTAKSPAQLTDIYYNSVGRNCQLLLNVPPDRDGVFDPTMLTALSTFGAAITSTFAHNLAAGATATNDSGTTNTARHDPGLAVDANLDTSWQPTARTGALVLNLGASRTFDVVAVQEDLHIGMRTKTFAVDTWNGTRWTQIASDTTIGNKKLVRLATPVTTRRLRLRITAARANPAIATLALFKQPSNSPSPTPSAAVGTPTGGPPGTALLAHTGPAPAPPGAVGLGLLALDSTAIILTRRRTPPTRSTD
jgi:alpha-L-fucosidase